MGPGRCTEVEPMRGLWQWEWGAGLGVRGHCPMQARDEQVAVDGEGAEEACQRRSRGSDCGPGRGRALLGNL